MNVWISKSSPTKQTALALASLAAGAVLMLGFRHYGEVGSDQFAGFLLGVLLAGIGVAGLVTTARQTVVVDPATRGIKVEDAHLWGSSVRTIRFDDVVGVNVGFLGKRSNGVTWYYLDLKLRTGSHYSLFAPGRFFPGGSDRATVEGWRQRLEAYLTA